MMTCFTNFCYVFYGEVTLSQQWHLAARCAPCWCQEVLECEIFWKEWLQPLHTCGSSLRKAVPLSHNRSQLFLQGLIAPFLFCHPPKHEPHHERKKKEERKATRHSGSKLALKNFTRISEKGLAATPLASERGGAVTHGRRLSVWRRISPGCYPWLLLLLSCCEAYSVWKCTKVLSVIPPRLANTTALESTYLAFLMRPCYTGEPRYNEPLDITK